jgi:hypothetical protein
VPPYFDPGASPYPSFDPSTVSGYASSSIPSSAASSASTSSFDYTSSYPTSSQPGFYPLGSPAPSTDWMLPQGQPSLPSQGWTAPDHRLDQATQSYRQFATPPPYTQAPTSYAYVSDTSSQLGDHTYPQPPTTYPPPQPYPNFLPEPSPSTDSAEEVASQTTKRKAKGYVRTEPYSLRRRALIGGASRKGHRCPEPGCISTTLFTRNADLLRHISSVHHRSNLYPCPEEGCERKGNRSFTRKDHLTEHLRTYHGRDIPKRTNSYTYG